MAKKILVIDDEPDVRTMLEERLKSGGYEVAMANNGKDGLKKLSVLKVDLIILDVIMPVMGGLEFFKAVKADQRYVNIPVMILTGRGAMKDTFNSLGADEFVAKPIDITDFFSRVSALFVKKALLMSIDPVVVSKVSSILQKYGYGITVAENEDDLIKKGSEVRCEIVLAHLPLVTREPADFIRISRTLRHCNPRVIIYSDVNVKGTEGGNSLVIDEIKTKWHRAGSKYFFDPRTERSLNAVIEAAV